MSASTDSHRICGVYTMAIASENGYPPSTSSGTSPGYIARLHPPAHAARLPPAGLYPAGHVPPATSAGYIPGRV
jgi:hypothetical protein